MRTGRDVVERAGRLIDQGVQEPERALPRRDELVIDERDGARKDRARAARPGNGAEPAFECDDDVLRGARDIGERARACVEQTCVGVTERLQVGRDGVVLVRWAREVVGEAARGERGGDFGVDALRAADRGDAERVDVVS